MYKIIVDENSGTATQVANPKPAYRTEIWYSGPQDGAVTSGTVTFDVKGLGSTNFESPTTNTIDLASPARLEIVGEFQEFEITVSPYVGTATNLIFTCKGHDS